MNRLPSAFRKPRKMLSRKESRDKAWRGSSCHISCGFTELVGGFNTQLNWMDIEFHGPAAAIPSLKNSKDAGSNRINTAVLGRIDTMDTLYRHQQADFGRRMTALTFGSAPVVVMLICGIRHVSFDLIGAMETVQDWLEPCDKLVGRDPKPRGWGVGVIENDSQVIPMPFHSEQLGMPHQHTIIRIRKFSAVRENVINFAAKMVIG